MTREEKEKLKQELVECLRSEKEITRIVIFGSFITSSHPNDMDVAVFQDSTEGYLPLAAKYQLKTRKVAKKLPLDIIPLKSNVTDDPFLWEVNQGEVVYER